jgi:predicted nuclease with TOPRIM domain
MNESGFGKNPAEKKATIGSLMREFDAELRRIHTIMMPALKRDFVLEPPTQSTVTNALKALQHKLLQFVLKNQEEKEMIEAKLLIIQSGEVIPSFEEGHAWQDLIDEVYDTVDEMYKLVQDVEDSYFDSNADEDLDRIVTIKSNLVTELQEKLRTVEYMHKRLPPIEQDLELENYMRCTDLLHQALRDFSPLEFGW